MIEPEGRASAQVSQKQTLKQWLVKYIFSLLGDPGLGGWRVSYVRRRFRTRFAADREAERLRHNPTAAEAKAMSEGRFVDDASQDPCSDGLCLLTACPCCNPSGKPSPHGAYLIK